MIISQDQFKCVSMNFLSPPSFLFYSKAMYQGSHIKSLKKNPTNFSSTHVHICVKDATPLMYFYLHPSQSIYNVKILLMNIFFLIGTSNVLFSKYNPEMPFQTVLIMPDDKKFLKHIKQSCLKVMFESQTFMRMIVIYCTPDQVLKLQHFN